MKLNNWKHSSIDLDKYLSEDDLALLRDKTGRKDKNKKVTIITRSLQLVKKAKKGDIESRNYLFLLHTPFMRNILNKKFSIRPTEFDDYLHECFEIFLDTIEKFQIKKSNNFIYLFQRNIYNTFVNNYKFRKRNDLPTVEYIEQDKEYEENNNLLSIDENLYNIDNDE